MIDGIGDLIKATVPEDNTLLEKEEKSDIDRLLDELKIIEDIVTYENSPSADPLRGVTVSTTPTVNDIIGYRGNLNAIIPAGFIMLHNDLIGSGLKVDESLFEKLSDTKTGEEEKSGWDKFADAVDTFSDFALLSNAITEAGGIGAMLSGVLKSTGIAGALTSLGEIIVGGGIALAPFAYGLGIAELISTIMNLGNTEPAENPAENNSPLTVEEAIEAPSMLIGYEANWQRIYDTADMAQKTLGDDLDTILTDWTGTINLLREKFPEDDFNGLLGGVEDISEAYYWLIDNDKIKTIAEQRKEEFQERLLDLQELVPDLIIGIDDNLEMPILTTAGKNRTVVPVTVPQKEEVAPITTTYFGTQESMEVTPVSNDFAAAMKDDLINDEIASINDLISSEGDVVTAAERLSLSMEEFSKLLNQFMTEGPLVVNYNTPTATPVPSDFATMLLSAD